MDNLSKNLNRNVRLCDFVRSLIGLHALTGCDTVSAFAGKGKYKALQLALSNASYVRALMEIGANWVLTEEAMAAVEAFVYQLYRKKCVSVDALRYELHCAKGGGRGVGHHLGSMLQELIIKLPHGEGRPYNFT